MIRAIPNEFSTKPSGHRIKGINFTVKRWKKRSPRDGSRRARCVDRISRTGLTGCGRPARPPSSPRCGPFAPRRPPRCAPRSSVAEPVGSVSKPVCGPSPVHLFLSLLLCFSTVQKKKGDPVACGRLAASLSNPAAAMEAALFRWRKR